MCLYPTLRALLVGNNYQQLAFPVKNHISNITNYILFSNTMITGFEYVTHSHNISHMSPESKNEIITPSESNNIYLVFSIWAHPH